MVPARFDSWRGGNIQTNKQFNMSKVLIRAEQTSAYVERMDHCYTWFTPNSWTADDLAVNFASFSSNEVGKQLIIQQIIKNMPRWLRRDTALAALYRAKRCNGPVQLAMYCNLAIVCLNY